ncbi:hypothetical protein [Halobaculum marinum]|uniref:Uncharacterized protein n=1 Tax=Halobaculum marinum TaxID=3031996 RepID=A0ABD5WVC1_9EURY|nr:hypothetical protein [Halobaculum sp. DT55]
MSSADALLGADRRMRLVAVAGATALVAVGVVAAETPWAAGADSAVPFLATTALLGGPALAAENARRAGGVLGSWLLAFGLVFSVAWCLAVPSGVATGIGVVVPVVAAASTATGVGLPGYALGEFLRRRSDGLDEAAGSARVRRVLLPRSRRAAVRWAVVAAAAFDAALAAAVWVPRHPVTGALTVAEVFDPLAAAAGDPRVGVLVAAGWVGAAAVPAARHAGLFVSWGVVFAPVFGGAGARFVDSVSASGVATFDVALAAVTAAVLAVFLGTFGFVVGVGARSLAPRTPALRR